MDMDGPIAMTTEPNTPVAHQTQILASLFSPAFPVGAFAYSHGLETAIHSKIVHTADSLESWIETCLCDGSGRNDAILMARAWQGDDVNDLALALAAGKERWQETCELGAAFSRQVTALYQITLDSGLAYPVAAGKTVRKLGCTLPLSLEFYLQAFVANLVSVGVRAIPIGQTEGQAIIIKLMPAIADLAKSAAAANIDDIGGCSFMADIAALHHETLEPRIYRT